MDILKEYEIQNPKRKIIFMNGQGEYNEEYVGFNLEIINDALSEHGISVRHEQGGAVICKKSVRDLLFGCGIMSSESSTGEALLLPCCTICDVMSACARIISHFKK